MVRFGPFAAIERPFQSFNPPIMRNFVLISSLFFLSVITCSISKSWIAIYSLAYPSPWMILAMSPYSSCSTSSSLVTAEAKACYHPGIIPEFMPGCSSPSALSNCNSMVGFFFLHGCYESCSSLRQLLLWNVSVFCGSY